MDEAFAPFGIGAEIAAQVADRGLRRSGRADPPAQRRLHADAVQPAAGSRRCALSPASIAQAIRDLASRVTLSSHRDRFMAIEITVPRLGWNMDEGVFVGWLKNEARLVKAGEPLFSLESDKAVQEVESLDSGRLRIAPAAPKPGQTVGVGTVIGFLLSPSEAAQRLRRGGQCSGPCDGLCHRCSPQFAAGPAQGPGAGNRLEHVAGTGRSGRIRERDVLAAAPDRPTRAGLRADPRSDGEFQVVPIDATRRAIAERMMQGAHAPHPSRLTTSIDATNLVNLRQQFKAVAAEPGMAGRERSATPTS